MCFLSAVWVDGDMSYARQSAQGRTHGEGGSCFLSLSMGGKKNGSFLAGWAAGVAYAAGNVSPENEKFW